MVASQRRVILLYNRNSPTPTHDTNVRLCPLEHNARQHVQSENKREPMKQICSELSALGPW